MIKYKRVRDVKQPTRGKINKNQIENLDRSAGIDFYVPDNTQEFCKALTLKNNGSVDVFGRVFGFSIAPHSHVLIPSGICCNLQDNDDYLYSMIDGVALIAFNKSRVGMKQLDVAATIIDEQYQGEIHISLTNTSSEPVDISFGEKIVQFLLVPIILSSWQEISDDEELFPIKSERGSNGFGSTGPN